MASKIKKNQTKKLDKYSLNNKHKYIPERNNSEFFLKQKNIDLNIHDQKQIQIHNKKNGKGVSNKNDVDDKKNDSNHLYNIQNLSNNLNKLPINTNLNKNYKISFSTCDIENININKNDLNNNILNIGNQSSQTTPQKKLNNNYDKNKMNFSLFNNYNINSKFIDSFEENENNLNSSLKNRNDLFKKKIPFNSNLIFNQKYNNQFYISKTPENEDIYFSNLNTDDNNKKQSVINYSNNKTRHNLDINNTLYNNYLRTNPNNIYNSYSKNRFSKNIIKQLLSSNVNNVSLNNPPQQLFLKKQKSSSTNNFKKKIIFNDFSKKNNQNRLNLNNFTYLDHIKVNQNSESNVLEKKFLNYKKNINIDNIKNFNSTENNTYNKTSLPNKPKNMSEMKKFNLNLNTTKILLNKTNNTINDNPNKNNHEDSENKNLNLNNNILNQNSNNASFVNNQFYSSSKDFIFDFFNELEYYIRISEKNEGGSNNKTRVYNIFDKIFKNLITGEKQMEYLDVNIRKNLNTFSEIWKRFLLFFEKNSYDDKFRGSNYINNIDLSTKNVINHNHKSSKECINIKKIIEYDLVLKNMKRELNNLKNILGEKEKIILDIKNQLDAKNLLINETQETYNFSNPLHCKEFNYTNQKKINANISEDFKFHSNNIYFNDNNNENKNLSNTSKKNLISTKNDLNSSISILDSNHIDKNNKFSIDDAGSFLNIRMQLIEERKQFLLENNYLFDKIIELENALNIQKEKQLKLMKVLFFLNKQGIPINDIIQNQILSNNKNIGDIEHNIKNSSIIQSNRSIESLMYLPITLEKPNAFSKLTIIPSLNLKNINAKFNLEYNSAKNPNKLKGSLTDPNLDNYFNKQNFEFNFYNQYDYADKDLYKQKIYKNNKNKNNFNIDNCNMMISNENLINFEDGNSINDYCDLDNSYLNKNNQQIEYNHDKNQNIFIDDNFNESNLNNNATNETNHKTINDNSKDNKQFFNKGEIYLKNTVKVIYIFFL